MTKNEVGIIVNGIRGIVRLVLKAGIAVAIVALLWLPTLRGEEKGPVQPSPRDKCPVCGMFVAKYPDWLGEILYRDGAAAFFDGAKDLFKYYFDLKKYEPNRSKADMEAIYVTEYYKVKLIAARGAYFVIGSDVYGPMGRELIPFETKADAEGFMRDHQGKRILEFNQVTPAIVKKLDD